jgi:hypothetical protein
MSTTCGSVAKDGDSDDQSRMQMAVMTCEITVTQAFKGRVVCVFRSGFNPP